MVFHFVWAPSSSSTHLPSQPIPSCSFSLSLFSSTCSSRLFFLLLFFFFFFFLVVDEDVKKPTNQPIFFFFIIIIFAISIYIISFQSFLHFISVFFSGGGGGGGRCRHLAFLRIGVNQTIKLHFLISVSSLNGLQLQQRLQTVARAHTL